MKSHIQILCCENNDLNFSSILVFFDQQRYLFNVGEGTQRLCLEHKVRLSRVNRVFFTQLNWKNLGGLPGMLLTVADAGATTIALSGPKDLLPFLGSIRYFCHRNVFDLEVTEYDAPEYNTPINYDDHLFVIPVPISSFVEENRPQTTKFPSSLEESEKKVDLKIKKVKVNESIDEERPSELIPKKAPVFQKLSDERGTKYLFTFIFQNLLQFSLPKLALNESSEALTIKKEVHTVCYICHSPEIPGKFDAQKAAQLGLKKGPKFGLLTKGQSVTTDDGRVINPSDCISPSQPGPIFIIIDCPNMNHFQSILSAPIFSKYRKGGEFSKEVSYVLHMTSFEVTNSKEYKEWMNSFDEKTQHVILNSQMCPKNIIFQSAASNQIKLNSIQPDLFNLPISVPSRSWDLGKDLLIFDLSESLGFPKKSVIGASLMKLPITPKQDIDRSDELKDADREIVKQELLQIENFQIEFKKIESKLRQLENEIKSEKSENPTPEISFLGTGAALPSKYRNVSATLVQSKKGNFILDCGEGTLGQINRRFGARISEIVSNIKMIFISHLHADHQLGCVKILLEHHRLAVEQNVTLYQPIIVVGPPMMRYWLRDFSHFEKIDYHFVDNYAIMDFDNEFNAHVTELLDLKRVFTVPVVHCTDSFGAVIESNEGWKIAYSGDCRPSEALADAAKDATFLIHEATFDDTMQNEALEKSHSTTGEAIRVGARMKAHWILLTHFSQRYPKIPVMTTGQDKVGIAFDFMSVNLKTVRYLPLITDTLRELFKEEDPEDEETSEEKSENAEKSSKLEKNPKSEKAKPKTAKKTVNK